MLVTGAGSGIGRATALRFARQGSRVLCVDIDLPAAEKTAVECQEIGPEAFAFEADVSDLAAMQALANTVHDTHGPLDVLVNNAGVGMSGPFLDTTAEDWDWILGINLRGVINGCQVFGPAMVRKGRGHVVNVSSGLGYVPTPTEIAYGTTKAAVLHFSRCLRADWRRHGVGVTAICPGVINTPIVRHTRYRGESAQPTTRARVERMFSRFGHKPDLVAKAIVSSVEKDRPVVPVGFESWLGWFGHHVLPSRATDVTGVGPVEGHRLMSKRTALVGGAVATAAGVAAAGVLAARRWARADDPTTGDPLGLPDGEDVIIESADGAKLAVRVMGPGDGEWVVLAHCWTGDRRTWAPVVRLLVDAGHRVAVYDQRGHGESTVGGDGCTLEALGDDVRAVLEGMDVTDAVLAGHSMGGMSIMSFCARHPDVAKERIAGVGLVATTSGRINRARGFNGPVLGIIGSRAVTQLVGNKRVGPALVRRTIGRRPAIAPLLGVAETFAATDPKVRSSFLGAMLAMDLEDGLAAIDIPTVIVCGTRDLLTPLRHSKLLAETIPGARLVVLPDCGHMLPCEAPQEVAEALRSP